MELPQIGSHCQLDDCNSLDFLPVACPLCQRTFCGNHRLPIDHGCSNWSQIDKRLVQCQSCQNLLKAPETENLNVDEVLTKHQKSNCKLYLYQPNNGIKPISRDCTMNGCRDIDPRVGPVHCDGCQGDFCLRHRHPSSHKCKSLNNDEQRKLERKLAAQEQLSKTFSSDTNKKRNVIRSVPAKSKNSGMVELMKMKSQAKGNASIPISSRIYIHVQCPKESKLDSQSVYFDKKLSVGKALDLIADICKVNNKNNTLLPSNPERLELYKCPEMKILNKSDLLEKVLKNLDTVLLERQCAVSFEDTDDTEF